MLPKWIDKLADIVGEQNVLAGKADCVAYSRDMSVHEGMPDAVVFVENTDQVSGLLAMAHRDRIPVTARAAGSSVTGAALPVAGGIVLNLIRMNRILRTNRVDRYAVVEPGVVCRKLNQALAPAHFYPPDPGSAPIATVGGMVSTNASGVRAVKYGTARDYVKAMEVVLAGGRVIRTGTLAPKSSSGYDLTRLFATSEGTLGIITELTVRILPSPEYSVFGRLYFPSPNEAGAAVAAFFSEGFPVSTCEILDGVCIDAVKKAMGLEIPEGVTCLLFVELEGTRHEVELSRGRIDHVSRHAGGIGTEWSDDPVRREILWSARHGLVTALSRIHPGARQVPITEDFGVPMSGIPQTLREIREIGERHGVKIATFGHIGDGNLHPVLLLDPRNSDAWELTRTIAEEFISLTLARRGTLSAEHGVGLAKAPYIRRELEGSLDVMAAIKLALDPRNILNPGKMGFKDSIGDIYDRCAFDGLRENIEGGRSFGPEMDGEILACNQCGLCTLACPTFELTRIESMNARGRNNLAFNLLTGRIGPSIDMAHRLFQCTLCDACRTTCPAEVRTSLIGTGARIRLHQAGLTPAPLVRALASIRRNGNPFMQNPRARIDHFPVPPPRPDGAAVLFWPGCVSSFHEEEIVPAAVKIFGEAGVAWGALGEREMCCGYLAHLSGDSGLFETSVLENSALFKEMGVRTLVTTCPGCFKAFVDLYPRYAGGVPEVLHAAEYAARLLDEGRLHFQDSGGEITFAYHDPCDLGRQGGIYEAPRKLLDALPGVVRMEFPRNRENGVCCGAGGGVKACDPVLSVELAKGRVLEARELGAEGIVTACGSCKRNLFHAVLQLRRSGALSDDFAIRDLMELIAEKLRNDKRAARNKSIGDGG